MQVIIDQDTDSIRIGDGTNLIGSTDVDGTAGLNTFVTNASLTGTVTNEAVAVDNAVAVQVPTTILPNRATIAIRVTGLNPVFFGSSAVSETNGYMKNPGEEIFLDTTDSNTAQLFAICSAGQTSEVRILQIGF